MRKRDAKVFLEDILESVEKIEEYVRGVNEQDFYRPDRGAVGATSSGSPNPPEPPSGTCRRTRVRWPGRTPASSQNPSPTHSFKRRFSST